MIRELFIDDTFYRSLPGKYVLRLLMMLAVCLSLLSEAPQIASAQESDANTETETETETETDPDPRTLWYMDNIPVIGGSGSAGPGDDAASRQTAEKASQAKAPDKLKNLAAMPYPKQERRRQRVRRKLAAYMQQQLGIILSETYAVHYIYTDETDYLVTWIGDTPYIYAFEMTDRGRTTILEADPDDKTRTTLLELAGGNPSVSDVHYWNGINTTPTEEAALKTLPVSANGERAVPYFNQGLGFWNGTEKWICTDWPRTTFDINGHTMKEAGCGFFAVAMAISYLRQEIISPIDFKENGQYTGDGAAVTVGLESAGMYGIKAVITASWEEAYAALQKGHPVMENVGPGLFARYGHFILLTGILADGRIIVNDPGNEYHTYWYKWETYDASVFPDNVHDNSTPYTIFG